ncbi:MAG: ATP-binding protein [Deltaproteobacteria bacterium]|nr:ATP-binding protein [Deltaproteobacteria bacterium]
MAAHDKELKAKRGFSSIGTFLMAVNLVILAIPITAIYFSRLYDNELVRQTEIELISQAVLVGGIFKQEVLELSGPDYGRPHFSPPKPLSEDAYLSPILPVLDLARSEILNSSLSYLPSAREPDPAALRAAERIAPILKESENTILSRITITDAYGIVISSSQARGLSMERNPEVSQALEGNYSALLRSRQQGKRELSSPSRAAKYRVFIALPIFNGTRLIGVVHISRTPKDLPKALYEERGNLLYLALAGVLLLLLVSLISSYHIARPLKRLALEARELAEGRRDSLPELSSFFWQVKEICELKSSVSFMAERLKKRSEYLKTFASGVSHEFKTPLSSIRGAMELISEHGNKMDPETIQKFESNILEDLSRLERLVTRLLALAKSDAMGEPAEDARVNLAELVGTLQARLSKLEEGFIINVIEIPSEVEMKVEKDALETVLINLIENSRESGAHEVSISAETNGSFATIIVSDDGPGILPEDAEKIFQPFYTTHRSSGGTGLGLNLARTLLAPYQGELRLKESPSTFEIKAPI